MRVYWTVLSTIKIDEFCKTRKEKELKYILSYIETISLLPNICKAIDSKIYEWQLLNSLKKIISNYPSVNADWFKRKELDF